ncbi:hypothetical protein BGZ99_005816 [Dissophora globulifera]|uniref:Rho GDP-dissociation inhibitor n=1 Tax=Dissophora globulifera TaxID=979702 RepID=A0A9P6USW9_9FUNG|nr:hypothetical protein BGZ99_005816 [Dissophora globulifera]
MSHHHQQQDDEDDFGHSLTSGYKPGEKKTISEYHNLDADDEALRRWKESLGVTNAIAATGAGSHADDRHNVVVLELALEVEGREDVVLDLTMTPDELKQQTFIIKEGVEYRLKVAFKVQHSLVSGLKYKQVVKRSGVRFDKTEEMIGSYAAKPDTIVKKFLKDEAPSGMIARGKYDVRSQFIDDDGTIHKQWDWTFQIKKDWKN